MRYIKQIFTDNKHLTYRSGDTINLHFPNNKVDLSSLRLYYNADVDYVEEYGDTSTLKRFMPRLSGSIIDRLIMYRNGEPIQDIKHYNIVYNILVDAITDKNKQEGDRVDTLNTSTIGTDLVPLRFCDFVNGEPYGPLSHRYFIDTFIGLIGEGTSSILDCTKDTYQLSIILAPREITYRGLKINNEAFDSAGKEDWDYFISSVEGNIEVVDEATPAPDIIFPHYTVIKGPVEERKNVSMLYQHKGPIDYILGSFIVAGRYDTGLQLAHCNANEEIFGKPFKEIYANLEAYTATPITENNITPEKILELTTENTLNNSIYFKREGLGLLKAQYTINGQQTTPEMDPMQLYSHAKSFFGDRMLRPKSITSFLSEFYVFPLRVDEFKEEAVSIIEMKTTHDESNEKPNAEYVNGGKVFPILVVVNKKAIAM